MKPMGSVEHSYGIVPLSWREGQWKVLLIQHSHAKYWGLPKGHAEKDETPLQTAIRELFEETHLNIVRFFSESTLDEHYHYTVQHQLVHKKVVFFVAEVEGELQLQEEEVSGAQWLSFNEALLKLTYETDRSICRKALSFIL